MAAVANDNFFAENGKYLLAALAMHLAIAGMLTVTMNATARKATPVALAISATLVDHSAQRAKREKEKAQADQLARERAEAEEKIRKQAEAQREEEARREEERQEAKRVADKREQQLAIDKKRKAEQQTAAKKKATDDKKRAADIKSKQAEKKQAEREASEQALREAELKRQLADEDGRMQAKNSGALNQYRAMLQQRIERNWSKPDSARPGIVCVVSVRQTAGGVVLSVTVGKCNGDDAVRHSIEAAVYRSSPLPLPDDMRLFEREFGLTLRPE